MKTKLLLSILFFLLNTNLYSDSPLNLEKSFDYDVSKIACDDGNAKECVLLSFKYIKGTDALEKDYTKAKIYADKACKLGNNKGCIIFLNIDEEAKKELLDQSCKDGNNTACKNVQALKDKKYYLIDGKCSRCGSTHIGKYLYGLIRPNKKLDGKINKGEIRLGGCMISDDSPNYHCIKCGVDLYEKKPKSPYTP